MFTLRVQPLTDDVKMPEYAHSGDAGMDIFAYEDVTIAPGERRAVATGFATEFPQGYVALVWDRSSYALKHGLKTMAGVIDAGYRGEWKIVLLNTSNESFEISRGDKIAQALFQRVISPTMERVAHLEGSSRGEGGFGSTGN